MALPPLWKVKRELRRSYTKIAVPTSRVVYDPVRKVLHDRTARWMQRLTEGPRPLTDRVAIFVVYQPSGVARSVFLTLKHLAKNGYSVLVVSNGALPKGDRLSIARQAALVIERTNAGYDFGAYRDGIRHLWERNHDLSRLVLLNDSTWFPLRLDDDSLARMEALEADLAGHIFKTESVADRTSDHVESHLLMFSRDYAQSSEFRRFWSDYRMSNYRSTTIKFGEKAITQSALAAGRRVETLMERHWLVQRLGQLNDKDLRSVLDHTIDNYRSAQKDASAIRRLAAQGAPWRAAYLDWVDQSLSSSLFHLLSATFVMPALVYGGMGFAKKAKDIRFHLARKELLELEASGMIPPLDDAVRAEIAQLVHSWTPPKGPEPMPRQRSSVPVQLGH